MTPKPCCQFGRKDCVSEDVSHLAVKPRRSRLLATVAVFLLLTVTVPTAQSVPSPTDAVEAFVERTAAYLQDFDPADNATTQQAKTEAYLSDIANIANALGYLICSDFDLGPWRVNLTPQATAPPLRIKWTVPGFGVEGSQAGQGNYKLEAGGTSVGTCSLPIFIRPGEPIQTGG